jgi:dUTP pyrophosphatase
MAKRYYKNNETVWLKEEKTKGKVLSLDIANLKVRVSIKQEDGSVVERTKTFMEIDKLKTNKKSPEPARVVKEKQDTILFAKVREGATIPSKREEDGAYDIYSALEPRETEEGVVYEMLLKKFTPNKVPTGLSMSLLPKYAFNLKCERGSIGNIGVLILSGLIDSGFRNEKFVNMMPLWKDVLLTSKVTEVEIMDDIILYPVTKAIAQGYVQDNHHLKVKEISNEELVNIPSQRGLGMLGSSGK